MPNKKIQFFYRPYEGEEVMRTVLDFEIQYHGMYLSGLCELKQDYRTFKIDRIAAVIDLESGELRYDVREFLGIEKTCRGKSQVESVPTESVMRSGRANEKYRLWHKKYFTKAIGNHFRNKVYASFCWRCFLCGAPAKYRDRRAVEFRHATIVSNLHFDHHIPRANGGLLIPGNIVVLCRDCNNKKADRVPETVYTRDEWNDLGWLLTEQTELLRFRFSRQKWLSDKRKYYDEIGLNAELIDEVLTNPLHSFFEGDQKEHNASPSLSLA